MLQDILFDRGGLSPDFPGSWVFIDWVCRPEHILWRRPFGLSHLKFLISVFEIRGWMLYPREGNISSHARMRSPGQHLRTPGEECKTCNGFKHASNILKRGPRHQFTCTQCHNGPSPLRREPRSSSRCLPILEETPTRCDFSVSPPQAARKLYNRCVARGGFFRATFWNTAGWDVRSWMGSIASACLPGVKMERLEWMEWDRITELFPWRCTCEICQFSNTVKASVLIQLEVGKARRDCYQSENGNLEAFLRWDGIEWGIVALGWQTFPRTTVREQESGISDLFISHDLPFAHPRVISRKIIETSFPLCTQYSGTVLVLLPLTEIWPSDLCPRQALYFTCTVRRVCTDNLPCVRCKEHLMGKAQYVISNARLTERASWKSSVGKLQLVWPLDDLTLLYVQSIYDFSISSFSFCLGKDLGKEWSRRPFQSLEGLTGQCSKMWNG